MIYECILDEDQSKLSMGWVDQRAGLGWVV